MKSQIIKSKRTIYGVAELIEFTDDFGKIINYSVIIATHDNNIKGGIAKTEEKIFSNQKEAKEFFNNQN